MAVQPRRAPRVRHAALAGFEPVCAEVGLDPRALLRRHDLDPEAVATTPDAWAPAAAVIEVLEVAAATSGCPTFALRMASHRTLLTLGPVGLVIAEEPTLRDSLLVLARFWPSYNEALRLPVIDRGATTSAVIRFDLADDVRRVQATELVAAVIMQVVQARLGTENSGATVTLRHPRPDDVPDGEYEALLGARVVFDADRNGVDLDRAAVDRVVPEQDPHRIRYTRQYLATMARPAPPDRADRILHIINELLPVGRCSAGRVAAALGVDRRTMHRWLAAEGQTFSAMVEQSRRHQAEMHLAEDRLPLTQVAERLGFAELSSFSRWFSGSYGISPSSWRSRCGTGQR